MVKIGRVPSEIYFMLQAHLVATRATCDRGPELLFDPGRHGVGAVIVKENRIIASGYNGSPPDHPHCDSSTFSCKRCGCKEFKSIKLPNSIIAKLSIESASTLLIRK